MEINARLFKPGAITNENLATVNASDNTQQLRAL
jgi:hypothetical protein